MCRVIRPLGALAISGASGGSPRRSPARRPGCSSRVTVSNGAIVLPNRASERHRPQPSVGHHISSHFRSTPTRTPGHLHAAVVRRGAASWHRTGRCRRRTGTARPAASPARARSRRDRPGRRIPGAAPRCPHRRRRLDQHLLAVPADNQRVRRAARRAAAWRSGLSGDPARRSQSSSWARQDPGRAVQQPPAPAAERPAPGSRCVSGAARRSAAATAHARTRAFHEEPLEFVYVDRAAAPTGRTAGGSSPRASASPAPRRRGGRKGRGGVRGNRR